MKFFGEGTVIKGDTLVFLIICPQISTKTPLQSPHASRLRKAAERHLSECTSTCRGGTFSAHMPQRGCIRGCKRRNH